VELGRLSLGPDEVRIVSIKTCRIELPLKLFFLILESASDFRLTPTEREVRKAKRAICPDGKTV
jgi:hypothetical protein